MVSWRAVFVEVAVIAVCAALAAAGIVLVVRWGAGAPAAAPSDAGPRADASPLARAARYVALMLAVGAAAGVLAAGAGGRLAMRLLAATSTDSDGQITEGGATIGEITVDGTLGFFVFVGVGAGMLAVALYVFVGSLLPRGRAGGVALGLTLLVLAGTRLEPMRADNFDFNLVGPDWLSVLSFTALAVFQGMVTWAVASRLNLRPLSVGRLGGTRARIAAGVLVLAALPGFASAVADILGSG